MMNFIVVTVMLTACLLITVYTLFFVHIQSSEGIRLDIYHLSKISVKNFGPIRAKFTIFMARFFNKIACGFWVIECPESIIEISKSDSIKNAVVEDLADCFKFYASMVDRFFFLIIVIGLILNFIITFSIVWYNYSHHQL